MKLATTITGSIMAGMEAEMRTISKAVTAGIKEAGRGLKRDLRKQVVSAGLGARPSRTWRDRAYPNKGYNAAAMVWSKAPQIIRAFDEGAVIKRKSGYWLPIPTLTAPKRGVGGKRINPSNFPEHRFGPLRFVYRRGLPSLLVMDGVRINKSGRVGRRAKGGASTKTGRMKAGMSTVAMFIMVPQVRLKKRLNVKREIKRWERTSTGPYLDSVKSLVFPVTRTAPPASVVAR